jgi:hypothetical protein
MLPEIIKKIVDVGKKELSIDLCRVTTDETSVYVTHYLPAPSKLVATIEQKRQDILARIQATLPECINFQALPIKKDKKETAMGICLTLAVPITHNSLEEILELSNMAKAANIAVCKAYTLEHALEAIHKDMKPYEHS